MYLTKNNYSFTGCFLFTLLMFFNCAAMQGPLDDPESSRRGEKTPLTIEHMLPKPLRLGSERTPANHYSYSISGSNSSPSERPIPDSPRPQARTKPHAKKAKENKEKEDKGKEKHNKDYEEWDSESEDESEGGEEWLNSNHFSPPRENENSQSATRRELPFELRRFIFPSDDRNLPPRTSACTFYSWNHEIGRMEGEIDNSLPEDERHDSNEHPALSDLRGDSNTFKYRLDKEFFESTTRPVSFGITSYCMNFRELSRLLLKGTGALIGFLPSTPATGLLIWTIGDDFNIPPGGVISTALAAWIMATTTPTFVRQLYERGEIIGKALTGKEPFRPNKDLSKPQVYKKSWVHQATKVFVFGFGVIDSTVYTAIMAYAERPFPEVVAGTGWAFFLTFLERYYRIGTRSIDRIFIDYYYDTPLIKYKRDLLRHQLQAFQQAIATNDAFVEEIYTIIMSEIRWQENLEMGETARYFASSGFFLRHLKHERKAPPREENLATGPTKLEEKNEKISALHDTFISKISQLKEPQLKEQSVREQNENLSQQINELSEIVDKIIKENNSERNQAEHLMNLLNGHIKGLAEDLEESDRKLENLTVLAEAKKLSSKEALLGYLSVLVTGLSAASRAVGTQYMLERVLVDLFSLDSSPAIITSSILAGLEVLFRLTEYQAQKEYMQSWANAFSLKDLVDFQALRKAVGWVSLANGGLFALGRVVPSWARFQEWGFPLPARLLAVIPALVFDTNYYGRLFEEEGNNIVTATTGMLKEEKLGIHFKRAKLAHWSRILEKYINEFNPETISRLFDLVLQAD